MKQSEENPNPNIEPDAKLIEAAALSRVKDLGEKQSQFSTNSLLGQQIVYQRALAKCSQCLLTSQSSSKSQNDILTESLESLRIGVNASKAYVFKNTRDNNQQATISLFAEACAPGIPPQINVPGNQNFPVSRLPYNLIERLSQGLNFGGPVEEVFKETPQLRDIFLHQTPPLLSVQLFPIFIDDLWWGFIGFDDCTSARKWNDWEVRMLSTASDMVSNTLHRWDIKNELEETLEHLESRIAKRTSELSETNSALNLEMLQRRQAQDDLENKLSNEELLVKISARLLRTEHIKENIRLSLKDLSTILGVGRIILIEFDITEFKKVKRFIEYHRPSIPSVTNEIIQNYVEGLSGLRDELHENKTILIPDLSSRTEFRKADFLPYEELDAQSLILSPLIIDQRIHGVLCCSLLETSHQSFQKNVRILDLVTSMLTSLLQRQHLIRDLETQIAERTHQLTTFLDMAILEENAETLNDTLQPILYSISDVLASDATCIHIIAEDQSVLSLTAQYGLSSENIDKLKQIEFTSVIERWLENGETFESSLAHQQEFVSPKFFALEIFSTFLANRIISGDKSIGILSCYRKNGNSFSSIEKTFISAIGELLGIIVENYRLKFEARELATIDERHRLAREIHDAISQSVYSLSLLARSASDALFVHDNIKLSENLHDIEDISIQAMREMRLLLYQLREELDDEDIALALDIRFQQVENRLGINASHKIDSDLYLPDNLSHHIWRIMVEALNNSVKHAEARNVSVNLMRAKSNIILIIKDDGVGFDVSGSSPGMGLKNIKERVADMRGVFEILSKPGDGTSIKISIPDEHLLLRG